MINTNKSLAELDISHNDLRFVLTQTLINALKNNINISIISIHNSYVFNNFQTLLFDLMSENQVIIKLSVGKPVYVMTPTDDYLTKTNIQLIQ